MLKRILNAATLCAAALLLACSPGPGEGDYDVIIRGGTVHDGLGSDPVVADVGILGDRIESIGNLNGMSAAIDIDAAGLVVAPGFINMLSWANESLLVDGRGMSDIKQGVTLEVMGEGTSMGPLNDEMKATLRERQGDLNQIAIGQHTIGNVRPRVGRRHREQGRTNRLRKGSSWRQHPLNAKTGDFLLCPLKFFPDLFRCGISF